MNPLDAMQGYEITLPPEEEKVSSFRCCMRDPRFAFATAAWIFACVTWD